MRVRTIGWLLGQVSALVGGTLLIPLVVALALGEPWQPFAAAVTVAGALGGGALLAFRRGERSLDHRSAFLAVTLSWLLACCIGAIPLRVPGGLELTAVDAIFESISGFTTTGATVLSGLDAMPRSLLLWRSIMQWIGGLGMVLIGVAVLPVLGVGGMQLYKAETPGPTKDKLAPRIAETAKLLWGIYLALTAVGALALWLGGMSVFDALCHAMCAVATGGFSTHDASLSYTNSAVLHGTMTLLMLVGGTSFAVLHRALTRGLPWSENPELRVYLGIFAAAALILTLDLRFGRSEDFGTTGVALQHATFQAASILTTSGFSVADYDLWPGASRAVLLLLFFVGGMAGSTSGGIKVVRCVLFLRLAFSQFFRLVHPHGVSTLKLGHRVVDDSVITSVASFVALWALLIGVGTVLFASQGIDLLTAASISSASLGNVGPGFGGIGPSHTYAPLEDGVKLISAAWMILGRLEIYTVLVIFTPAFWRG